MTENPNLVKDFLKEYGYIVNVNYISDDCYEVIFPENATTLNTQYTVVKNDITGVLINTKDYIACEQYVHRLVIASDILNKMKRVPIHEFLISYNKHNERYPSLSDIIPSPKHQEQISKEILLSTLLSKAIKHNFPKDYDGIAIESGIWEGYRLLKGFF